MDRTAAVINSCTALILPKGAEKREERAEALWELLESVGSTGLDVVVPAASALVDNRLMSGKAAINVLSRMRPMLQAANYRR